MTELVDTHVHLTSPDTQRYPLQPLDNDETWYRDAPCSLERYRELMDTHGVTAAYLVQTMTAYTDDNTYAVESALSDPERFASVVYVDLDPLVSTHAAALTASLCTGSNAPAIAVAR